MSDWNQRQLCPDGACVGVIGSDGTCKVCGKQGVLADASASAEGDDDEYEDDDGEYEDADEDGEYEDDVEGDDEDGAIAARSTSTAGDANDPEWGGRKLCPDGACVGVIGDSGTCKVCGRSAA